MDQNTTNDSELSSGFLKQRRVLILISIILPLYIFEIVSITSIDVLDGVKIDTEQLSIKYILLALLGYFWVRYWQYSKVEANIIKLKKDMQEQSDKVREKFFKKIACPNIIDCFDVERCYITEKEDVPESKNNIFLCRDKNIETYGVAYRYEDYFISSNHNKGIASPAEIEKIGKENWQLIKIDKNTNETRSKPIFSKVFTYYPFKLKSALFWVELKFYWKSTYFTGYLLPYYFAAISAICSIVGYFYFW